MGHGVHAKGQLLLRVLVKLLPHRKRLGDHLALLDPLGFIVTAANNPDRGTDTFNTIGSHVTLGKLLISYVTLDEKVLKVLN